MCFSYIVHYVDMLWPDSSTVGAKRRRLGPNRGQQRGGHPGMRPRASESRPDAFHELIRMGTILQELILQV